MSQNVRVVLCADLDRVEAALVGDVLAVKPAATEAETQERVRNALAALEP